MRAPLLLLVTSLGVISGGAATLGASSVSLRDGWRLAPSANLSGATGGVISSAAYDAERWLPLAAPVTVLAALSDGGRAAADDFLPRDGLFFGRALNATDTKLFDTPWWYRHALPAAAAKNVAAGGKAVLTFKGLNYRANVWVAGKLLATNATTEGAYAFHDVDITAALKAGSGTPVLAVEVSRSYDWGLDCDKSHDVAPNEQSSCRGRDKNQSQDLGITFVDWAPAPHDANMGLWRGVELSLPPAETPVTIRYAQVRTTYAQTTHADLEIVAEVINWGEHAVTAPVKACIGSLVCATLPSFTVAAGATVQLLTNASTAVTPETDLWWPWQMGAANQHTLTVTFGRAQMVPRSVGLRDLSASGLDANNNYVVSVNGQKILIRGGGWGPDLLQRNTPLRNQRQLLLTRSLGLNAIRLEGKLQDDDLFEQASSMGIMMLPGICCCDAWQNWEGWTNDTLRVAKNSLRSQVKRLRGHASVVTFLYSSDELPPASVEQAYLDIFREERWAGGLVSSAADHTSPLTGHSGVKMAGPYGWVPPNYWYSNTTTRDFGSAYGFATEISPGAAPLTLDSMRKTMPESSVQSIGSADWNYHCGARFGAFGSLKHFTPGVNARYGNSSTAAEYLKKAQLAAYESHRAMFEGYSRNKYVENGGATGLIQWMLNSAWPSNMWHLFDYYLQIGGSGYGAKKACSQNLHLLYSYDEPPSSSVTKFDMVQIAHTDTEEDQFRMVNAVDADACCIACLADSNCTHAVLGARGECYLKNMKHNDKGNTMTPKRASANEDCTLCLKRELPASASALASQEEAGGGTVAVVNSLYTPDGEGLTVEASQYDLLGRLYMTKTLALAEAVPSDGTQTVFKLPRPADANGTVLLRLRFKERANSDNWYWIPPSPDKFEMGGCFTGCVVDKFANMRDLSSMPRSPAVNVSLRPPVPLAGGRVRISVLVSVAKAASAAASNLAFFVRLRALDAAGKDVLPATWSDNFVTVLGGASVTLQLEHEATARVVKVEAEAFNAA